MIIMWLLIHAEERLTSSKNDGTPRHKEMPTKCPRGAGIGQTPDGVIHRLILFTEKEPTARNHQRHHIYEG